MAHEQTVLAVMEALKIADKHLVGDVMVVKAGWKAGPSAVNNAYKVLSKLADIGKLQKGSGFFRVPSCKSEYEAHARLLTSLLAKILLLPFEATVLREHTIRAIGLRPDALVLLRRSDEALCFILEAVHEEPEESLQAKYHAWQHWPEANHYLGQLFGVPIAHCDFVRSEQLDRYIEEIINVNPNRHLSGVSHDALAGGVREAAPARESH